MTQPKTYHKPGSPAFHTTRWTMVMRAQQETPEARAALGELCEAYWMPIFNFLKREKKNDDECRELTQEFLGRLLEKGGIGNADPGKGRFRSYLLGALKNFLSNQRRAESAQKRGGDTVVQSIESSGNETSPGLQVAAPSPVLSDAYFDRHWALAVMERGLAAVEESFKTSNKTEQFEALKPWLMGDAEGLSQTAAAAELDMTPGAVKVAIHRLRQKFGEAVRAEIAETVDTQAEIRAELRYLIEVLQTN